ncbi:MAG: hypothetical protein R3242_00730 [Akkermansiaceae bacterium]|nr:hypothetical protein [Akkermansiaceae bacterium]
MKHSIKTQSPGSRGVTLLEMTVVILLILSLIGIGTFSAAKIGEWKLGRKAGEELRAVHAAQRLFLADNPTTPVSSITADDLLPYMQGNPSALPTVESLDGTTLTIKVDVNPPVVDAGGGAAYDPSGSSSDSLWDIGK